MTGVIEDVVPADVRAVFSGTFLRPEDDGYHTARRVHNGLIDKRPALIARCHTVPDVVDAVRVARARELEVSIRGGGHNVAGKAVTDGGLMIDLAPMKGVHVDPRGRRVWAQGGVTWRDYNRAAGLHGLATTGGLVSTTGIAGLTLGGGEGWLMGKFGMSVDHLLAAEVVTAEGQVLVADDDTNADLFWGLRGGGGNFGVVTAFEYRAHPVSSVLGGIVAHPLGNAAEVIDRYLSVAATAPDELTTGLGLVHDPGGSGTKLIATPLCHCGDDHGRAEEEVRALRVVGPGGLDMVARMPYPAINTMLDDGFPRGTLNYWKSAILRDLTPEAMGVMIDAFERCPSPMTSIVIIHYHGAMSRVDPTATAFPHRGPGFSPVILTQWTDPADTHANIAWTQETFEALRPHTVDKVYVNNLSADDAGMVRDAYGANWARLVGLKRKYDPTNFFRLNHNINPAG
jgi:FAD/FMN-containing dehydrogenase